MLVSIALAAAGVLRRTPRSGTPTRSPPSAAPRSSSTRPARHALTFQMVGRDELPNAVALNASLFNASRVVGPAVAGVMIAAVGVGVCFALNAVSFLAVLRASR